MTPLVWQECESCGAKLPELMLDTECPQCGGLLAVRRTVTASAHDLRHR